MNVDSVKTYFNTCFLLIIPIMGWNLAWTSKLPKAFQSEIFWRDIPTFVTYGENIFRSAIILFTLLMPLSIQTKTQKQGLFLYGLGTFLYFTSWLVLIYFPTSPWSNHLWGFMAPAYTPLIWLMGIRLIGRSFSLPLKYHYWLFILVAILFLLFHNFHTAIIYFRLY